MPFETTLARRFIEACSLCHLILALLKRELATLAEKYYLNGTLILDTIAERAAITF